MVKELVYALRVSSTPPCAYVHNSYFAFSESLYRLADKYGEDRLKALCFDQIIASLTPDNLINELAHPFTAVFPAFIDAYKDFAIEHWVSNWLYERISWYCR